MGRLTNEKKSKLLKIETERTILSMHLENNFIEEGDLINLLKVNYDYGFPNLNQKNSYKLKILRNIFNCPFLLCDQKNLSIEMKKVLPIFLGCRYAMEKEELESQYKLGYLNKEELEKELDMLDFCYYKSSFDGKNILKEGHVKDVSGNMLRYR